MTNQSHGNLVGNVVLKDIYIIKNKVNDKVYIGQSVDSYDRWKHHKTAAKTGHYKNRSLLYEAMRKYGVNNFYYEILESQIENYNEREKYWISFYGSIAPNGYNILEGGEQYPNFVGITNSGAAVRTENELNSIIEDIMSSNLRLTEIASKYHVPLNTIRGINTGTTYRNSDLEYPIRKKRIPVKLSNDDVESIIDLLLGKQYRIREIAKLYNVSEETINCINVGDTHKDVMAYITRPIRKDVVHKSSVLSEDQISDVIWLLQNTSKSLREIARKHNVGHRTIMNIKNGAKTYRRENLVYPLRPNN